MKQLITSATEKRKARNVDSIKVDNTNQVDNKLLYEKASMRELEAADDYHPLKNDHKTDQALQENDSSAIKELTLEMESVALDWKTLRNITECSCSAPFDHFSRKVSHNTIGVYSSKFDFFQYHCWRCGDVFCMRCIDKHTKLPGHLSHKSVPVCRPCYDKINCVATESP